MTTCTVTRIDDGSEPDRHRFRIEGGEISPEWSRKLARSREAFPCENDLETPWCEFTIWHYGNQLSSYCGSVWPSAWPHLFESHKGTAQSGSFVLATSEGMNLIAAAERAWHELG